MKKLLIGMSLISLALSGCNNQANIVEATSDTTTIATSKDNYGDYSITVIVDTVTGCRFLLTESNNDISNFTMTQIMGENGKPSCDE